MLGMARPIALSLSAGAWLLLAAACTVQLAPDYEQPIVDRISELNEAIQTHMARVADGTPPGLTEQDRARYAALQGRGRAVIFLVRARPQAQPGVLRWLGASAVDRIPADGDAGSVSPLDVPTDDQIAEILKQLDSMKEEDLRQGLEPGQYRLWSNAIDSFMRNALTYEMALKR